VSGRGVRLSRAWVKVAENGVQMVTDGYREHVDAQLVDASPLREGGVVPNCESFLPDAVSSEKVSKER
jgi:hypothetical protein